MNRRTFLTLLGSGLVVGCGNGGGGAGSGVSSSGGAGGPDGGAGSGGGGNGGGATAGAPPTTPNVLVILCDQLRGPQWFPNGLDEVLPNMAALRAKSVVFDRHYTAAIQCSPSRASLVTGLYARQHFVGKNVASDEGTGPVMDPRFPTWGTLFDRLGMGYERRWFGKWHLSVLDPASPAGADATWASYGFSPGLSYDVAIGDLNPQGDAATVAAFGNWLAAKSVGTPWCTTVSLVNPHDIAQTYGVPGAPAALDPPKLATALPANYESAASIAANKPRLQTFFLTAMDGGNAMPHGPSTDPTVQSEWLKLLNLYIAYQKDVDLWIGQVLSALANSPHAASTIVVFTADHGEHGGSHGLRNKHGTAYEETLRTPLYVYDPTGYWTGDLAAARQQMTSSVDVAPMMLTFASGGGGWRNKAGFEHLAKRPDLTALVKSSSAAPVRSYILHSSDSIGPAPATLTGGGTAANHVTAIRTDAGKLVLYETWATGTATATATSTAAEVECYDYGTDRGQQELENLGASADASVQKTLRALYDDAGAKELTETLADPTLVSARASALDAYWKSAFSA